MNQYHAGHVKRNPENGFVALRTANPEPEEGAEIPFGGHPTWMVISLYSGPVYMRTDAVDSWDDIYVAGPPSE